MESDIGNLIKVLRKDQEYIEFDLRDGSTVKIMPKNDSRLGRSFAKLLIKCSKDIKIETRHLREKEIQK